MPRGMIFTLDDSEEEYLLFQKEGSHNWTARPRMGTNIEAIGRTVEEALGALMMEIGSLRRTNVASLSVTPVEKETPSDELSSD